MSLTGLGLRFGCFHCCNPTSVSGWEPNPCFKWLWLGPPEIIFIPKCPCDVTLQLLRDNLSADTDKQGAQCPLRPSESKSSRSRTQELASLLPVSFSLSTFSLSLYFYSIFCFLSLLLLSLSFLPLYTQTQTHTALQVPDSEAGALTLGSQCPRV